MPLSDSIPPDWASVARLAAVPMIFVQGSLAQEHTDYLGVWGSALVIFGKSVKAVSSVHVFVSIHH